MRVPDSVRLLDGGKPVPLGRLSWWSILVSRYSYTVTNSLPIITYWPMARVGITRLSLGRVHYECDAQNEKGLRRETQALEFFGGRYWDRTSDPCRVKAVLYR